MVDVGKREDGLLDFVNRTKANKQAALLRIEMYREAGGLTAREMGMLNTLSAILTGNSTRPEEEAA